METVAPGNRDEERDKRERRLVKDSRKLTFHDGHKRKRGGRACGTVELAPREAWTLPGGVAVR